MSPPPADAVLSYLASVREVRKSGLGTAEQSFYPAVNSLLTDLGQHGVPQRLVLAHPAGVSGDLPDVALYEETSNVLVLPVEVKPASTNLDRLIRSAQAARYARTFGGGTVLVTNLWEFAIARLDSTGVLQETGRVALVQSAAALDKKATVDPQITRELQLLLEDGCQVRGAMTEPELVARLLAYHGTHMRDAIVGAGDADALLAPISAALRDGLQIDLPADLLVPTVVQTLVYGLFASWLESDEPGEFNWMDTAYRLDVPVFADVLHAHCDPSSSAPLASPSTWSRSPESSRGPTEMPSPAVSTATPSNTSTSRSSLPSTPSCAASSASGTPRGRSPTTRSPALITT